MFTYKELLEALLKLPADKLDKLACLYDRQDKTIAPITGIEHKIEKNLKDDHPVLIMGSFLIIGQLES